MADKQKAEKFQKSFLLDYVFCISIKSIKNVQIKLFLCSYTEEYSDL